MLTKLLKHEFKATGRILWVVYAAMILLSVLANVSFHFIDLTYAHYLNVIAGWTVALWILSLVVGSVIMVVLLIRRFQKSLLTDEGYLAFTLPVSVHQLVLSKLIVAVVWLIVTVLVVALGVFVALLNNETLQALALAIQNAVARLTAMEVANLTAAVIEVAVLAVIGTAATSLQYYSAMAIGYGFTNHKALWSVLTFFAIQIAIQFLVVTGGVVVSGSEFAGWIFRVTLSFSDMQSMHLTMVLGILMEVAVGAVFYGITVWNLKHRLNLA